MRLSASAPRSRRSGFGHEALSPLLALRHSLGRRLLRAVLSLRGATQQGSEEAVSEPTRVEASKVTPEEWRRAEAFAAEFRLANDIEPALAREFATVRELACADELAAIRAIVNAILHRKVVARDCMLAAGREDVAARRESDVETCYEILRGLEEREAS